METSDSEYFESADEDFRSDDEDTQTVKSLSKNDEHDSKCVSATAAQLKKVKLTNTEDETNTASLNNNRSSESPKKEVPTRDDENNVDTCEVNTKNVEKKEPVKKLGSKLIKSVDVIHSEEFNRSEISQEPQKQNLESDSKLTEDTTVSSKETTEACLTKPVKEESKDSDPEENLWDDTEIDWGKEKEKEENMWDNDEWEPVEQHQQENIHEDKVLSGNNTTWGSWGNWGVSSILTTATQSVSTITQGITNVLETGIGVPEPEELARINRAEKEKLKESTPNEDDKSSSFGLGNFVMGVSHLTKLVESTSTKVISGGLDTLETIGKKTMEVLQEGDPGLKKKRAFLKIDHDKPVLSQLLREAKEKAEKENEILEQKHFAKRAKNYETLFDDHQGLVHLEALEMLSKQCDIKLQNLLESNSGESLTEIQETLDQVKELCELPDEDEDEQANWAEISEKLNSAVSEINVPISYKKLFETWEETESWLNNLKLEVCDERELHQQGVETLAQLTAIAVEQFHKTGELLLVKEHRSTADEADSLVQLTTSLTSLIGIVAAKFSDKLNAKSSNSKNKEIINELITNVFFEAANSSSYIQDAFQLLVPVLQVGAV